MRKLPFKNFLPIWWAWQWRVIVASFIGTFIFSFVIGFFGVILGISKESVYIITNLVSLGITIYASIYFFAYIFSLKFKNIKIYIAEKNGDYIKKAVLV